MFTDEEVREDLKKRAPGVSIDNMNFGAITK
jgi:hypothetical protein